MNGNATLFSAPRFLTIIFFLLGILVVIPCRGEVAPLKIGIIGDSTVCIYTDNSPRRGWGQMLPLLFTPTTTFLNLAEGGRSTKSFPKAKWQQILDFKPDFVLIQFGHNDSHQKTLPESTDAATDFKDYLRGYIKEARDVGATPILVTPPHRRTFKNGELTTELEPYVTAMQEVGREMSAPVVDLFGKSGALMLRLGEEGSTDFTINASMNEDQPTKQDRSHFTIKGATELARIVAAELSRIDERLKTSLARTAP